jgi:hypothetical protein
MLPATPAGWVATDLSAVNGAVLLEALGSVLLGALLPWLVLPPGAEAAPPGEPQTSQ